MMMKMWTIVICWIWGLSYGSPLSMIPSSHPLLVKVQERLGRIQTLRARFEQQDLVNHTLKGTFYLSRPGRLRFEYDPPAPFLIVANGSALIYEDASTQQANFFPLNVGPAALLLSPKISFKEVGHIECVEEDDQRITVRVFNSNVGHLTFFFDQLSGMIQGWTTIDAQGNTIRVTFSDVQENGSVAEHLFRFQQKPRWIVKRQMSPFHNRR